MPIQLLSPGPKVADPIRYARLPHVLLLLDGFPQALGGGERVALRMAANLPGYGFRVSLLTLSLPQNSAFDPREAPCPVYLLPLTSAYNVQALRGAIEFAHFLQAQQVRLVQTFFESSDLWGGLVVRMGSDAKLVWSRRDMGILRGRKHTLAYRLLRNLPHAVLAVSDQVAQHSRLVDGVPGDRVHTVYNGLDRLPDEPADPPRAEGAHVVTLGNLRRVKGHDLLLEAARQLAPLHPEARFSFAGEALESDYFKQLQALSAAPELEGKVKFLGKVTDQRALFRGASVFVLPSRSEGFSNALLEAMASGLPCIATDVGGNAEAIEDGVSGLIVPPEDPAALARAVDRLLSDPGLAARLGTGARERVRGRFSTGAMMRRLSGLYSELLFS